MIYGLIVTEKELRKLDDNNIDYEFWDAYNAWTNNDTIEIEFEFEKDYEKALKLLKRKRR